jgi:hypothetical protein
MDIKKAGIKYLLLLMTGLMILLFSFTAVYAEDITETGITEDDAVTAAADSAEMNAGTNAADGSADISEEISEETAAELFVLLLRSSEEFGLFLSMFFILS